MGGQQGPPIVEAMSIVHPPHFLEALPLRLGFAAFAFAFLLPGHYPPWTSFEQEALAALGFACLLLPLLNRSDSRFLSPGPLGWTALALATLPLIQLAAGLIHFRSDAILPALYLSGLALCIVGARSASPATKHEVADLLFGALTCAATVSAAMAWSQWLQQYVVPMTNGVQPGSRVNANLGQPNHLATLLALGCAGALQARARGVLSNGTASLLIAWLTSAIVMSQSRTGWVAVSMICAWLLVFRRHQARPISPWVLAGWLAAFASMVMAWTPLNAMLFPVTETLTERLEGGSRLLHWAALWDAALARPWFGYGWNQVGLAQLATALDHPPTGEMLTNSHNTALDLVLWCGLPIGLTVVALLTHWIVGHLRAEFDDRKSFLMLGFALISAHALVEYPLDHAYFLLPWGLFIGLADDPAPAKSARRIPRQALVLIYAITALMGTWIGAEYLKVDSATREVRLSLALVRSPATPTVQPPSVQLLDSLRELHRMAISQARAGMSTAELARMGEVSDRFPTPPLLLRDALAAGLNGQPERAIRRLAQLCAIHRPARCKEAQEQWRALSLQHPLPQPPGWHAGANTPVH